jgi:hypothetical protein
LILLRKKGHLHEVSFRQTLVEILLVNIVQYPQFWQKTSPLPIKGGLVSVLLLCIWHQGHGSGSLDRHGQLTLMYGTVAGDSARQNLASFRYIPTQFNQILVIYAFDFISAEIALASFFPLVFFQAANLLLLNC